MRPVVPPRVLDAALALALGLAGALSGVSPHTPARYVPPAGVAVLTAMGLAVLPRRRFPAAVLAAEAAGVVTLSALHSSLEAAFLAVLVASYSAAVYGDRRLIWTVAVLVPLLLIGAGVTAASPPGSWPHVHFPVPTVLAAVGAWLVGLVIRRQLAVRDAAVAALAERADLIAARQAEGEQRALLAERLRIARELHDIVAHHLSVVVIQAQGAQRMADRDPRRALIAMAEVERTGRTALEEMRRLLGLLRTGEAPETAEAAGEAIVYGPARGLADIDELAQRFRGLGLAVTVLQAGTTREVADDIGLAVYRVTQEALTNVLKHAGPAAVDVALALRDDDLELTITDDGRGAAAQLATLAPRAQPPRRLAAPPGMALPGSGLGTAGMTERVAALGGTLTAGPRPGGGYQVCARIPLEPAAPAPAPSASLPGKS
jgi:signal transduction histidine kinase